jgi:hypothetical protein
MEAVSRIFWWLTVNDVTFAGHQTINGGQTEMRPQIIAVLAFFMWLSGHVANNLRCLYSAEFLEYRFGNQNPAVQLREKIDVIDENQIIEW